VDPAKGRCAFGGVPPPFPLCTGGKGVADSHRGGRGKRNEFCSERLGGRLARWQRRPWKDGAACGHVVLELPVELAGTVGVLFAAGE
jgi:hypothetical protein